jgi:hypothetical protein
LAARFGLKHLKQPHLALMTGLVVQAVKDGPAKIARFSWIADGLGKLFLC